MSEFAGAAETPKEEKPEKVIGKKEDDDEDDDGPDGPAEVLLIQYPSFFQPII